MTIQEEHKYKEYISYKTTDKKTICSRLSQMKWK